MGNCLEPKNKSAKEPSRKEISEASHQNDQASQKKPASAPKSWDLRRQKLNPKDYEFRDKNRETLVKPPGSINGEQFVIDSCQGCNIYLCDNTAQVLIDDCVDCKFYIGPCASSVFVRNVKNSQFVVACQQFRTREAINVDVMIFSQTPPIIESSNHLRFGCFKYGYFELQQQFQKAELNIWNNRWSEIFDFTKKKAKNFAFLPEDTDPYELISRISELPGGDFSDPMNENTDILVPITNGDRPKLFKEEMLLVILPGYENVVESLVPEINHQSDFDLIKSRAIPLTNDQILELPQNDQAILRKLMTGQEIQVGKDNFIFLRFGSQDSIDSATALIEKVLGNKKCFHAWTNNKHVEELSKLVFETWREGE